MPLNLGASQQGTNSFTQPKVVFGEGLDPNGPQPELGFSWPFTVDQQPVMVVALPNLNNDLEAYIQISPDAGTLFTDLWIHDRQVLLDNTNTSVLLTVAGTYRVRVVQSGRAARTVAVYTSTLTHEPNMPMVNLAIPGPTGPTGPPQPGPTGPTGATGPTGSPGGPTGPTGPEFMLSPYDFGAGGTGGTDDTGPVQAWLNAIAGGAGYGKAGTFLITDTLLVDSNTTVWGAGKAVFKLYRADPTGPLLLNKNFGSDSNINWYDTSFEGDPDVTQRAGSDMAAYIGVTNFNFVRCRFQHWRLKTFAASNSHVGYFDHCEFYDWGATDSPNQITGSTLASGGTGYANGNTFTINGSNIQTLATGVVDTVGGGGVVTAYHLTGNGVGYFTASGVATTATSGVGTGLTINITSVDHGNGLPCLYEGGSAAWFADVGGGNCSDITFSHCYIHDGHWSGIFLGNVPRVTLDHNEIITVREAAVVGGGSYCNFDGNIVFDVQLKDCSGQGMELTMFSSNVNNNNIAFTDLANIYFLGASVVTCTGNTCDFSNQLNSPAGDHIGAITVNQVTSDIDTLLVANNTCSARDGKGIHGISVVGTGPYNNVTIGPNQLGPAIGGNWQSDPVYIGAGIPGLNFIRRGNSPSADCDYYTDQFLINSVTDFSVVGVPFKPRTVQFNAISPNNAGAYQCLGSATDDLTGAQLSTTTARDGTGSYGTTTTSGTGFPILVVDGTGGVFVEAYVTSYTDDGFVVHVVTHTADVYVNYTAFP